MPGNNEILVDGNIIDVRKKKISLDGNEMKKTNTKQKIPDYYKYRIPIDGNVMVKWKWKIPVDCAFCSELNQTKSYNRV